MDKLCIGGVEVIHSAEFFSDGSAYRAIEVLGENAPGCVDFVLSAQEASKDSEIKRTGTKASYDEEFGDWECSDASDRFVDSLWSLARELQKEGDVGAAQLAASWRLGIKENEDGDCNWCRDLLDEIGLPQLAMVIDRKM